MCGEPLRYSGGPSQDESVPKASEGEPKWRRVALRSVLVTFHTEKKLQAGFNGKGPTSGPYVGLYRLCSYCIYEFSLRMLEGSDSDGEQDVSWIRRLEDYSHLTPVSSLPPTCSTSPELWNSRQLDMPTR